MTSTVPRVPTEAQWRMMSVECPRCGATEGHWCRAASGRRSLPHRARWERAVEAGLLPLSDDELRRQLGIGQPG